MFHLYHHNHLQRLAELLAELMDMAPREHVLQPDTIVVPNQGVGRWLQIQLAEHYGIAANLKLPLPAKFIWDVLPKLLPGSPNSHAYERSRMAWHVYALLPAVAQTSPHVAHYLGGEPHEVLRWQLAQQLADVFDQYLIYRPKMLYGWQNGNNAQSAPEVWQAQVWRALVEKCGRRHRASLLDDAVRSLQSGTAPAAAAPDNIYCFGLGALPPEYLKFFYALGLGHDRQVHFLLPNPCAHYWGDIQQQRGSIALPAADTCAVPEPQIQASHPLLSSLGRATRDLLRVLYSDELQNIQEPDLGAALDYSPPTAPHLLAQVQRGIIDMQAGSSTSGASIDDISVQIHACHGPLREIQVLHDQLLDLLSRDSSLNPRDIVVMMPDVSRYSAAIQSVFGAAQAQRRIAWSLSDRSQAGSHPILRCFTRLLDLPLSRWRASEVLELASVPAVMQRFQLDPAGLQTVSDWLQAAGVRWGLDDRSQEQFGAAETGQFTWQFGFDRLLLGLAQNDENSLFDGVAAWSDLEGSSALALGHMWHLLQRLAHRREQLELPASAIQWQDRLNLLLDDLFAENPEDEAQQRSIQALRQLIAKLTLADDALGQCPESEQNLPWQVVREVLLAELNQSGERQPFLAEGVNFCGMVPLRAVPFRVVCMLGMDDTAFPRQDGQQGLNLLRAAPQLGDMSVRDDDRLLFLQALMAAQDVFYLSYIGQDVASGELQPPSPLIGEWLDFLHQHHFAGQPYEAVTQRLLSRQAMHPFSPALFSQQQAPSRLFSFAHEWTPPLLAARTVAPGFIDGEKRKPATNETERVIELDQLKRFFDHPSQYFLQQCLNLQLDPHSDEIEDEEPLHLNGLQRWQLRHELLQSAGAQDLIDVQPNQRWQARGLLPPAPLGQQVFTQQAELINQLLPIQQRWQREAQAAQTSLAQNWLDIDIPIVLDQQRWRLRGRIHGLWANGLRLLRPGGIGLKHQLRSWIDYLCYLQVHASGQLQLAGIRKGKPDRIIELQACISAQDALQHLQILLNCFEQGQCQPLAYMPELAEQYLQLLPKKTPDQALEKVNADLGSTFTPHWAMSDPWFRALLDSQHSLGQNAENSAFCYYAEQIGGPLLQHMSEA